jgi:hypothetical protein
MIIEGNLIDNIYSSVKRNKLFDNRLCYCKDLLLKEYLHKSKFFLIELIQEFEKIIYGYAETIDESIFYKQEYKEFLCNFPYISKKIVFIFSEVEQEKMKLFAKRIKEMEKEIKELSTREEQIKYLYSKIINDILKYFEISILNLITFNVKCQSYKNLTNLKTNCKNIDFCYNDYFSTEDCRIHKMIEEKGEFLHIFVVKELVDILDKYLEILVKYYNGNLNNVDILVDYTLIEQYEFNEKSFERYQELSNRCKNIYILNYKHLLENNKQNEIMLKKICSLPNIKIDEEHPYKEFF